MTRETGGGSGEDPTARLADAERRMADAEALLEIASAQLSVAARNIANANAAEREYRRATWHYTQLMKHRITVPLQTIIGMADTLRDMPELERSRRQAMVEAIGQQARSLRELCLTADPLEEPAVTREPARLDRVVTDIARARTAERVPAVADGQHPLPDPPNVRRFRRSTDR